LRRYVRKSRKHKPPGARPYDRGTETTFDDDRGNFWFERADELSGIRHRHETLHLASNSRHAAQGLMALVDPRTFRFIGLSFDLQRQILALLGVPADAFRLSR
jgi:hypothetical protein